MGGGAVARSVTEGGILTFLKKENPSNIFYVGYPSPLPQEEGRSIDRTNDMLTRLTITDIVLIDSLHLDVGEGFTVLTGETGAGKTILLDALSFALGSRGDAGLVRKGQAQGVVSTIFSLIPKHGAFELLQELGLNIEAGEEIHIRRVQMADGRTRALVNDQAISAHGLKQLGGVLVEISGQHDARGLMDEKLHIHLLDSFGGYAPLLASTASAHAQLKAAQNALRAHEQALELAQREREYLQTVYDELIILNPKAGEEEELAQARSHMMLSEKMLGDVQEAYDEIAGYSSPIPTISSVMKRLERKAGAIAPQLEAASIALGQALDQLNIAAEEIGGVLRSLHFNPRDLEATEERLFAIRAAARKHRVPADELPNVLAKAEASLQQIHSGEQELARLSAALVQAQGAFEQQAQQLSAARLEAAGRLEHAVMAELPALKLERAIFKITLTPTPPNAFGQDDVQFLVQTNPGADFAPLSKIASGGELSRFLLGLKVALADVGSAPTLVFDEIDTGVGGAVAAAMGARLQRLGHTLQVLAITHAPQVAASARAHFHIRKTAQGEGDAQRVRTSITPLDDAQRLEELARMLSGEHITPEARAAAERLMGASNAAA